MDLEITLRVNGAAHPLWAKSWSSLPVTWHTAHASSRTREAAGCHLAHNLLTRSCWGNPAASGNQQLVQQRVLLQYLRQLQEETRFSAPLKRFV